MAFIEQLLNAITTGMGAGIGSYYGSKLAIRGEKTFKKIFEDPSRKEHL